MSKTKKRKTPLRLFLAGAVLALCTVLAAPAHALDIETVKVGCFPIGSFFQVQADGTVTGYGADYTSAVFEHTGLAFEYVPYASWVEALDALSKSEIDMLAPAQHTPERDETYLFDAFPIGTEYGTLLTLSTTDALVYEDYATFDGLDVGVVPSLVFLDDFEQYESDNDFAVQMHYYKDTPALLAALNAGEVDAVVANMMVKTDAMKLLARFGAAPFYYMFRPEAASLQATLNSTIDRLTSSHPELQGELSARYFPDLGLLPFSREELDYIAGCGPVTVACAAAYPPFSYLDENGEVRGIDRDVLDAISKISGLQFVCTGVTLDEDTQENLAAQNFTLAAGTENDSDSTLHGSRYTESYLTVSKYFVGKKTAVLDPDANCTVAVMNSAESQTEGWLASYPGFSFVRYGSIQECAAAVRAGAADFMLGDRYSMENLLAAPQNAGLMIFPAEVIESDICLRVLTDADDAETLVSILNKSIRNISKTDKERFISEAVQATRYNYTVADFAYQYRYVLLFAVAALAVLLVALSFVVRARRKATRQIAENEAKLRNITNNINGGVVVLKANEGLEITYANDGFLELIGCPRDEFEQNGEGSYLAYVHPDDLEKVHSAIESQNTELSLELRVLKADGNYLPALFNCTVGERSDGVRELYCVILDMTEQNRLLEQLRIEKRRTDLILDRVEEIFYEINLKTHEIATSGSFREKFGWTLPGHTPPVKDYGAMWHTDPENLEKLRLSTEEMYKKKEPCSAIVQMLNKRAGRTVWCEVIQHPILDADGKIVAIIGLIRDVDEQVSERERLIEQAQHDPLTGLYNKEAFEELVTATLRELPEQNHALIFIDLDRFKSLNDTLGHMTGDRAICDAADKLRIIFSNYDILSRFGGDEFCIFVKNIPIETLRGKMDWLVDKLHATYRGEKGEIHITCSCGIACTDKVGFTYKTMMESADKALYFSKENGRDRYTFFSELAKD